MSSSVGFTKYISRGAYHWRFLSRNPLRHHCPTTARYKAVLKSIPSWKGKRVVDIGCGDGALLYLLARQGALLTGVEPDPIGRQLARKELSRRSVEVDLLEELAGVPSGLFDVAVCAEVIEHVTDIDTFLAAIKRVLKPAGLVVLSTPVRLTELPLDSNHVREYFPSELRDLLEHHFTDVAVHLHIPIPGLMLYYWRPWFLLRRPVIAHVMNLLDILIGLNCVTGICALDRYHTIQVAVAKNPNLVLTR
jgi:SAM-dependent methyltransferase